MITEDEWLDSLALECSSCPRRWDRPCPACQAGGICDGPMCRCWEQESDLDEEHDDDKEELSHG